MQNVGNHSQIIPYDDRYREQVQRLVLGIQNGEAKIGLSLEEQPDLQDIRAFYLAAGGNFWIALEQGEVAGTIGLMPLDEGWCALKKFFVRAESRSRKVGLALYERLLAYAQEQGVRHIVLDTPSVARRSHAFYERAGFVRIDPSQLPVRYVYPDRDSLLYRLDL